MRRHVKSSCLLTGSSTAKSRLRLLGLAIAALTLLALVPAGASAGFVPGTPATLCTGTGSAAGQCQTIRGVAVDNSTGHVYAMDVASNFRVEEFDATGTFVRAFGVGVLNGTVTPQVCTAGTGCLAGKSSGAAGALGTGARGIAVDPDTHLVYFVSGSAKVAYYDGLTGEFKGEFVAAGSPGTGQVVANPPAPQVFSPSTSGIAVDRSNPAQHYLYVATGNAIANPSLPFVIDKFKVPVPATSTPPAYVCQITGKTVPSASECKVGGSKDGAFDGFLFNGIGSGVAGGPLAVDPSGNLFMAEAIARNTVSMFDSTGAFVKAFAATAPVATSAATGRLFITSGGTEAGGNRVEEFSVASGTANTTISLPGSTSLGSAIDQSGLSANGSLYVGEANQVRKFSPGPVKLNVVVKGTGTGTVTCKAGAGSFEACAPTYPEGTALTLLATPDAGSEFALWAGGCTTIAANECSLAVDTEKTVTTAFVPTGSKAFIGLLAGNGSGSLLCKANGGSANPCASSYPPGTQLTVSGNPAVGSQFNGFSAGTGSASACTGAAPCTFTLSAHSSLKGTFNLASRVVVTPQGQGKVSASGGAIQSCATSSGICAGLYDQSSTITLAATPSSLNRFAGWSGADVGTCDQSGATLSCQVTIPTHDVEITASFVANTPIVSLVSAYQVADVSARLFATVDPRGTATAYAFQYGTTPALGSSTEPVNIGSGTTPLALSQLITGLNPNTTYYFKLVATNLAGASASEVRTFTTRASAPPLPDQRAYEQVSPPEKGLTNVDDAILASVKATIAEDGDSLAFCNAGAGGALLSAAAYCGDYLARRTPLGWASSVILPVACGQGQQEIALFGNLDYAIISQPESATCGVDPLDPAAPVPGKNLYRQSLRGPTPVFDLLTPQLGKPAGAFSPFNSINGEYLGISHDATHIVYRSTGDQAGEGLPVSSVERLYEWDEGSHQVRLVSRDTADAPLAGTSTLAGRPTPTTGGRTAGYGAVSSDGSRILFQNPVAAATNWECETNTCELYLRENATTTYRVSEQECTPGCPENSSPDVFIGANPTGDRVLFRTGAKLVNEDPSASTCIATGGGYSGCDLYLYRQPADPVAHPPASDPHNLTLVTTDNEPADGTAPSFQGLLGESDDGDTVFFVAGGQLVAGQSTAGGPKVFRWRWNGGSPTLTYLGALAAADDSFIWAYSAGVNPRSLIQRVTPDGSQLLVDTMAALQPLVDQDSTRDVYRWSEQSGWDCLSCQAPGSASAGGSNMWGLSVPLTSDKTETVGQQNGVTRNADPLRIASEDGKRVFFTSKDRLTDGDVNDAQDVYEWNDGTLSLISAGTGSADSRLVGTTLTGDDVFFVTSDRLVGWDTDTLRDIYDARIGGGFPEPPPTGAACEGEACRGAASAAAPSTGAATGAFEGPGNGGEAKPQPIHCRKGTRKVTIHGRTVCKKAPKHHKKQKRHSNRKGR